MKDSFVLYTEYQYILESLEDDEAGQLFKAILCYVSKGEIIEMDRIVLSHFNFIKNRLDRDNAKWEESKAKRVEAGKKGGKTTQAKESNATQDEAKPSNAKQCLDNQAVDVDVDVDVDGSIGNTPPKSPKGDDDERFNTFWAAYPNKKAKGNALKVWKKLKPSKKLLEIMLAAIEKAKKSDEWQKDGGQFIPHPATWLNGSRWLDEFTKSSPVNVKKLPGNDYEMHDYGDSINKLLNNFDTG